MSLKKKDFRIEYWVREENYDMLLSIRKDKL